MKSKERKGGRTIQGEGKENERRIKNNHTINPDAARNTNYIPKIRRMNDLDRRVRFSFSIESLSSKSENIENIS